MTATVDFELPAALAARQPPEARGLSRDGVRLLVGDKSTGAVSHHRFVDLPGLLRPGDLLVVNVSATVPAAVDAVDGSGLVVHFCTELPAGPAQAPRRWVVELRRPDRGGSTVPYPDGESGQVYRLPGGMAVRLVQPYSDGRLWVAAIACDGPDSSGVLDYLSRYGRPIRYGYVTEDWPLSAYQTVFGIEPGSAEMPSAGRPFSPALVTELVSRGIAVVPLTLHTGVASAEAHERP